MFHLPGISPYARIVYRYAPPSWKHVMRYASSRHLWPGSETFLNNRGISHFNEDDKVDQLVQDFLNETPILDDKLIGKNRSVKDSGLNSMNNEQKLNFDREDIDWIQGKDNSIQKELCEEFSYDELVQDLEKLMADNEAPTIDSFINNCFNEITELENSANLIVNESLDEFALGEVKKVMANTGFTATNLAQSNDNLNNINITMRGAYKNITSELSEIAADVLHKRESLSNKSEGEGLHNTKELRDLNQQEEDKQLLSNESNSISTYKPFQTIEVPVETTKAEKTETKETLDHTEYDLTTNDLSGDEAAHHKELQTVLDDTKSRILMRYALMKALYVLESGGSHCKARICFRSPKKT